MTRSAGNVVLLSLANGTDIRATDVHPVWSVDREEWVPAGDFEPGELVDTLAGPVAVHSVDRLESPLDVYNIEVHGEHVFRVTADGVLVHNAGTALCGGVWQNVVESMTARARAYQLQITGRSGQSFLVNGVKFDGATASALLEAKGPGYSNFVSNSVFRDWYRGADSLVSQALRQVKAADGVRIEWHVAENSAAVAIRNLLADNGITGITVIFSRPM